MGQMHARKAREKTGLNQQRMFGSQLGVNTWNVRGDRDGVHDDVLADGHVDVRGTWVLLVQRRYCVGWHGWQGLELM
jgi:hypothetical protein